MSSIASGAGPTDFIRAQTRLRAVPHAPDILLHVADEAVSLWEKTEEELGAMGLPPPFWAFAWAGGQALARYVLDNPALVRERRVLDLGSGSGLVAIAAAKAGAAAVIAAEIDAFAAAAIALNAAANGVHVEVVLRDVLDDRDTLDDAGRAGYDVVLVGDLFYEQATAARVLAYLDRQAARGATILVGDPGRSYLPKARLALRTEYDVPVTRALEDSAIKRTAVWTWRASPAATGG